MESLNSDKDTSSLSLEKPEETDSLTKEDKDRISQSFPVVIDVPILPEARDIPPHAMSILCMSKCGMSIRDMASSNKISRGSVEHVLRTYKDSAIFELKAEQIRAIQAAFVRSKRVAALAHITDEKLRQAPAKDLAHIVSRLWDIEVELSEDRSSGTKRDNENLLKRVKDLTG